MARSKKVKPPASLDPKNTPWTIVDPRDPHHPMQKLNEMIEIARSSGLALGEPLAYIRANWDPKLPKMWEVLLEQAVASAMNTGNLAEVSEILSKMTAMSGVAPRSRMEISASPEPDLSHLSDEDIARLRGIVVIENRNAQDPTDEE